MRTLVTSLGLLSLLAAPMARSSGMELRVPTGAKAGDVKAVEAACANPRSKDCAKAMEDYAAFGEKELLRIAESGDPKYKPLAYSAASLPYPALKAAAAAALGNLQPDASDTRLLTELLNHPVPKVRHAAVRALSVSYDEKASPLVERAQNEQGEGTAPDTVPTEKELKVPLPPGASYLYFASVPAQGRADFASGESVDKVSAFYAGRFGAGLTLKQFAKQYALPDPGEEGAEPDPEKIAELMKLQQEAQEAMMAAMRAGKSPEEAAAEMQRMYEAAAPFDTESLTSAFDRPELFGSVRVFVAEKAPRTGKPVRLAVVYRDLVLGKTGLTLITPPPGR